MNDLSDGIPGIIFTVSFEHNQPLFCKGKHGQGETDGNVQFISETIDGAAPAVDGGDFAGNKVSVPLLSQSKKHSPRAAEP
jgi:hypothetical protein